MQEQELPPYPEIARQLQKGSVVWFLGAGANAGERPDNGIYSRDCDFLPLGSELSEFLAYRAKFKPEARDAHRRGDLAFVSSYYEAKIGREPLYQTLREIFHKEAARPTALHHLIAAITTPALIVTTNYDNLMERALAAQNREYLVISHPAPQGDIDAAIDTWSCDSSACVRMHDPMPPNQLDLHMPLTKGPVIYKMHGSVSPFDARKDSFFITEDDYVERLQMRNTNVPWDILVRMKHSSIMFVGYSLSDWNLRVLLCRINNLSEDPAAKDEEHPERQRDRKDWAIQHNPRGFEEFLWRKRNVNIYDVEIRDFVTELGTELGNTGNK